MGWTIIHVVETIPFISCRLLGLSLRFLGPCVNPDHNAISACSAASSSYLAITFCEVGQASCLFPGTCTGCTERAATGSRSLDSNSSPSSSSGFASSSSLQNISTSIWLSV
uniref:Uncharacterized protein n=1 Tax=Zea mays TaxID=4577 RepID=C0PLA7_MAIZE|nr:unknown [Zea mays]